MLTLLLLLLLITILLPLLQLFLLLGQPLALDHVTGEHVFRHEAVLAKEAVERRFRPAKFVRVKLSSGFESEIAFRAVRGESAVVILRAQGLGQDLGVGIAVVRVVDVLLQGRLRLEPRATLGALEARRSRRWRDFPSRQVLEIVTGVFFL